MPIFIYYFFYSITKLWAEQGYVSYDEFLEKMKIFHFENLEECGIPCFIICSSEDKCFYTNKILKEVYGATILNTNSEIEIQKWMESMIDAGDLMSYKETLKSSKKLLLNDQINLYPFQHFSFQYTLHDKSNHQVIANEYRLAINFDQKWYEVVCFYPIKRLS
jgi:hypothetical protein